jgi:hypothetical protein
MQASYSCRNEETLALAYYADSAHAKLDCSTWPYMVAYSLTDPLNFFIFVFVFDYDCIWSGMQMKTLKSTLSSL